MAAQTNHQLMYNAMKNKVDTIIKLTPGDFKVTTSENSLLSQQAVTSKGIPISHIKLQLNPYPNIVVTISHFQCTAPNT